MKIPNKLDMILDNYPDIESRNLWIDSAVLDNSMTEAYGAADFDGDMLSLIGLYTQEANMEAKKLINSKKNLIKTDGSAVRNVSNEGILSLYMMTK